MGTKFSSSKIICFGWESWSIFEWLQQNNSCFEILPRKTFCKRKCNAWSKRLFFSIHRHFVTYLLTERNTLYSAYLHVYLSFDNFLETCGDIVPNRFYSLFGLNFMTGSYFIIFSFCIMWKLTYMSTVFKRTFTLQFYFLY